MRGRPLSKEPDTPFSTIRRRVGIFPASIKGCNIFQSAASQPINNSRLDMVLSTQRLSQHVQASQFAPAHAQSEVGRLPVFGLTAAKLYPLNRPIRQSPAGAVMQQAQI